MFRNDYSEIACKEVYKALEGCLKEQNTGYGLDIHSDNAKSLICKKFGLNENESAVHFLGGGTQANMTVISYFLRPYEGVICCDTGHINVHETGAVEGSGHKVYTVKNCDGKLMAEDVERAIKLNPDEHTVKYKMVYISDSTETGSVYSESELKELRKVCDKYGLMLFLDGARLGVALTSSDNDLTPEKIAKYSDVFYIGGTKNGAMFGEAVVIKDKKIASDFRWHIKNKGAMFAKGFVLGIQFERLFQDNLYFDLANNSNKTAEYIRNNLKGVEIVGKYRTNQIFMKFNSSIAEKLMDRYGLELWTDLGSEKIIRLVTSFATELKDCEEFVNYVNNIG